MPRGWGCQIGDACKQRAGHVLSYPTATVIGSEGALSTSQFGHPPNLQSPSPSRGVWPDVEGTSPTAFFTPISTSLIKGRGSSQAPPASIHNLGCGPFPSLA